MHFAMHRFHALAKLSAEVESALATLGDSPVRHMQQATIQREAEPARGIYLLLEGWVASSMVLPNGTRLVQKVHLPGDLLSTPSMALSRTADTLTAVTDATTSYVPYEKMGQIFASYPRLAAMFVMAVQMERLALMDMLAATGNASARESLARLLLDLHGRLNPIGLVTNDSFDLPLTQELIGDLLGLTSVHVNRTFRALDDEGLIKREGHRIQVDVARLRQVSPIPLRKVRFDPEWLPA